MTFDAEAYRALARLTTEMARLAEAQDFENLSNLCPDYERLSAIVATASALTPGDVAQVEEAIRDILDNQQRITESAGPWLSQVRKLLRENRQEQSLIDVYRAAT